MTLVSGSKAAEQTSRTEGRAARLGPPRTSRAAFAVVASLLLGGAAAGVLTSGSPARHAPGTHRAQARFGGLPGWLPKPTIPVNRVVKASAARRALAIQGDAVSVDLSNGRVLVTAVGPETPEQGKFPVPATSPCTFIVTFADPIGSIPLDAKSFSFIDEDGHVRHPKVRTMNGGTPPTRLTPGRTISVKVYDVLPTGDGGLSWAPEGGRPIATWDFDVEID